MVQCLRSARRHAQDDGLPFLDGAGEDGARLARGPSTSRGGTLCVRAVRRHPDLVRRERRQEGQAQIGRLRFLPRIPALQTLCANPGTNLCTYLRICVRIGVPLCIYLRIYLCTSLHLCTYLSVYLSVYLSASIYVSVCVPLFIYLRIYLCTYRCTSLCNNSQLNPKHENPPYQSGIQATECGTGATLLMYERVPAPGPAGRPRFLCVL
jgi:hypothetical protein